MKKTDWQLIIVGLIIVFAFSRCYNSQKATEQVNKADSKFPEIVAKLARDKYPCTQLLKTDTAVVFKDTTVYIECPDTLTNNPTPFETIRFDTINNVVTKIVKVPVTIRTAAQTITRWFEDSAKLKLAAITLTNLQADTANYRKQIIKLDGKVSTRNKWLLWLLIIVICETLWILRKPIIKLFTAFI